MDVGVRDLKARLSEYLDRVEHGEVISVTSRGRRVAQIIPVGDMHRVQRGLEQGWVTRAADAAPAPVVRQTPRPGTPNSTQLIRADRDA